MEDKDQRYDFEKFTFESGIPVPSPRHVNSKSANIRRLIREMKPGQSVVLPIGLRNAYNTVSTEFKGEYTYRTISKTGFRVWRLK